MNYRMTANVGGGEKEYENPAWETIEHIIEALIPADGYYLILEAEERIADSNFMQVAMASDEHSGYTSYWLEIQFALSAQKVKKSKTKPAWRQYRLDTPDVDVVKNSFREYYLHQRVPDVAEWQDITGNM